MSNQAARNPIASTSAYDKTETSTPTHGALSSSGLPDSSSISSASSAAPSGSGFPVSPASSPPFLSMTAISDSLSSRFPTQPKQPSSSECGSYTHATCSGEEKKFL